MTLCASRDRQSLVYDVCGQEKVRPKLLLGVASLVMRADRDYRICAADCDTRSTQSGRLSQVIPENERQK